MENSVKTRFDDRPGRFGFFLIIHVKYPYGECSRCNRSIEGSKSTLRPRSQAQGSTYRSTPRSPCALRPAFLAKLSIAPRGPGTSTYMRSPIDVDKSRIRSEVAVAIAKGPTRWVARDLCSQCSTYLRAHSPPVKNETGTFHCDFILCITPSICLLAPTILTCSS